MHSLDSITNTLPVKRITVALVETEAEKKVNKKRILEEKGRKVE